MLTSIVGVVVLLGGLIFFHELGHYLVAKFFKVRVEVFSLGFGKKIFRRKMGETEYALSLVPLGGYVKLMGDDPYKPVPPEEAHRAFSTQKLYKRFAIVAAGPVANLLLAYVLFTLVYWIGQPTASTRIGSVLIGSPAWEAGFRAKDRIAEINGQKFTTWNELEEYLKLRANEKAEVTVDRGSEQLRIPYAIAKVRTKNEYGEDEEVGGIKGILPMALEPVVGVSNPESLAYKAGLRTNDQIAKIGSREIVVFEDINESLQALWKETSPVVITVKRSNGETPEKITEQSFPLTLPDKGKEPAKVPPSGLATLLGIYPTETFVKKVNPESPAEKAGLRSGDRIAKVGDKEVFHFDTIVDYVQEKGSAAAPVLFTIEREGKPTMLEMKPLETTQEDPITREPLKKFMVGFAPAAVYHEPELIKVQVRNPIKLVSKAFHETNHLAKKMVVSLVKLAKGDLSPKHLGGPVLIATVAGKSLDAGIVPFLQIMALISINLFLLNLFPIPILDGGHLLFFTLEGILRRPVPVRVMEIANQVGMVFILMLVGLTLFNDISRIATH